MVIKANFQTHRQQLLLSAQEAEQAGELLTAIELYKGFHTAVSESSASYPAELFTRLPLLLLQVGREQEGWQYFHRFIRSGVPGRALPLDPSEKWLDRAALCDKARLFLQRAGHYDRAVLYGVQFYIARCLAVYHCRNLGQLGPMRSQRAISGLVRPLLRKANKENLEMAMVSTLKEALRLTPTLDMNRLMARIAMMIAIQNAKNHPVTATAAV